eukprot:Hpha_TRINITY_DN14339_c0_g1::TRINITY_DN14339_c0_g1_i2::g.86922::m.86922
MGLRPTAANTEPGRGADVVSIGPSTQSKVFADVLLLLSFLGTFTAGKARSLPQSVALTVVTGILNALFIGVGHNFLHQADSFRRHYLDVSGLNSATFRMHHAISHHPYTNTVIDAELNGALPQLSFFPDPAGERSEKQKREGRIAMWFRNVLAGPIVSIMRFKQTFTGGFQGDWQEHLAIIIPLTQVALLGGLNSVKAGVWRWLVMLLVSSNAFMWSNYLTGPHFNDECWHQGDTLDSNDWGILQIQTNTERVDISQKDTTAANLWKIPSFGLHHLHHLFPTIDAYQLAQVVPLFEEHCKEWGVEFSLMTNYELSQGLWKVVDGYKPNDRTRNGIRAKL